jgi:hypothetical protein
MSTDKRKNTAKESSRNNKNTVQDLPSKSPSRQEADQVKGGTVKMTDIIVTSRTDKSSP